MEYIQGLKEEDFNTTEPFEYVLNTSPFESSIRLEMLIDKAKELKLNKIRERFELYKQEKQNNEMLKKIQKLKSDKYKDFNFGNYIVSDDGIFKQGDKLENVCYNNVIITERIRDKDTDQEYITIQFNHYSGQTKSLTIPRDTIATPFNIITLTNDGLDFNSSTSGELSKFFTEFLKLNSDKIQQLQGVSRLGWTKDKDGNRLFLPYDKNKIRWTGEPDTQTMYDSIEQKGHLSEWVKTVDYVLDDSRAGKVARLILGASVASVLGELLNTLPFFLHLWSSASGTGKTVMLLLASSIWGNPDLGKYTQSFQTTKVGSEIIASTLNNLPLIMDEAQLAKDNKGNLLFSVYDLAAGIGRSRGTKSGGVIKGKPWVNAIITSGESPLVEGSHGSGAFARVIDVNIQRTLIKFDEAQKIIEVIKNNYGQAGKTIINHIKAIPDDILRKRYDKIVQQLDKAQPNAQQKQLMTIAQIKLADELITEGLQITKNELTIDFLLNIMLLDDETELGFRVAAIVKDYIEKNIYDFQNTKDNKNQKGIINNNDVYILRATFSQIAKYNGFSEKAALKSLHENNLIEVEQRSDTKKGYRYDVGLKVGKMVFRCIKFINIIENN